MLIHNLKEYLLIVFQIHRYLIHSFLFWCKSTKFISFFFLSLLKSLVKVEKKCGLSPTFMFSTRMNEIIPHESTIFPHTFPHPSLSLYFFLLLVKGKKIHPFTFPFHRFFVLLQTLLLKIRYKREANGNKGKRSHSDDEAVLRLEGKASRCFVAIPLWRLL